MGKLFVFMVGCAWLGARDTLLLSLCLLKGTGTEYSMKKLWVKLRTVRSLTHYCQRKNLDLGKINLICCQLKIE